MHCAEVCTIKRVIWTRNIYLLYSIPPFTKGKKQLSRVEIRDCLSTVIYVRIQVERVIGVVRQKFSILHSTLPINVIASSDDNDASFVDKIVAVCCALCNCCDSVVVPD